MSSDALNRARRRLAGLVGELEHGEAHAAAGRHGLAARAGYDAIEAALKAALAAVGVDPPTWVDVGPQLDEHRDRFSPSARAKLDALIHVARVAWEEREAGFESGVGQARAERLYDDYDSRSALDTAERVRTTVKEILDAM
ncbi:MAG: HEPN domain-containing protein [Candidatus Eisenbacteria bacterium]|nr:HEPN domain-containing protein [Candidatus Eisenbacteria bacterium]